MAQASSPAAPKITTLPKNFRRVKLSPSQAAPAKAQLTGSKRLNTAAVVALRYRTPIWRRITAKKEEATATRKV